MLIAVVLGNRINDDGSMSEIMRKRLETAIKVNGIFSPERIVLSGGIANKKVSMSEAQMMYGYLVEQGIPGSRLVLEDKSLTTKQNAEFSVPVAAELGASEWLLLTSAEHVSRSYLNPIKLFQKQLQSFPQIKLCVYSE